MIVYRFERNGIGPYISRANSIYSRESKNNKVRKKYHALYNQYIKRFKGNKIQENWQRSHRYKKYMYGCSSKEQLRTYFGGNFKPLFKEGFRIKRYKVPDEEMIDMGIEVAFPVKYHKLQTVKKIEKIRNK